MMNLYLLSTASLALRKNLRLSVLLGQRAVLLRSYPQWRSKSETQSDSPVVYTKSEAGQWKAKYSYYGDLYTRRPKYEPYVLIICICSILIYFCILREENDLDEWLSEIGTNVPPPLQEYALRASIADGLRHGEVKLEEKKKLEEIIAQKQLKAASNKNDK